MKKYQTMFIQNKYGHMKEQFSCTEHNTNLNLSGKIIRTSELLKILGVTIDNNSSESSEAKQASTRVLYTSLIFSLKSRDSTCLVVYLDVNSLLKARLALGLRFKMFLI